jgi:hypothetical protein
MVKNMGNTPAVRGAEWIGSNGVKATLLVNMDDKQHQVKLPDGDPFKIDARSCIRVNNP